MKQDYKTVVSPEKLDASKKTREELLDKWGFEPLSMMWLPKIHNKVHDSLVEDTLAKNSYETHNYNVRDGALSQTPPIVAERFIKFFSEPGELVVNPMMGRGMYNIMANYVGRNSIGFDVCREFYDHVVDKVERRVLSAETLDPDNNRVVLHESDHFASIHKGLHLEFMYGDSRHLGIPDNCVDYVLTSPPYWKIEKYGDIEPEQIGRGTMTGKGDEPTYEEFLTGLQEIFAECYRVLKPGKFMTILLNDFRVDKKLYMYHCDTIKLAEQLGFIMHDLVVYNLSLHPLAAIFTSQIEERKTFAKMHEYAETFRKPE